MESIPVLKERHREKIVFRRFSRKKFAAFVSMHKVVHIGTLLVGCTLIASPVRSKAQTDSIVVSKIIDLEEVEIVGQKSPVIFEELPRMVSIVSSREISSSPASSIADMLRFAGNADIRQRGKFSIQSDVSIRGGSFDHSLILFNGINISDPQTGHLSLNLPVERQAIERVEILNGPAARVHGTNAFTGALNFVTRPASKNFLRAEVTGGSYGLAGTSVTVNHAKSGFRQMLHVNGMRSDGYMSNTDFSKLGMFYQGVFHVAPGELDFQVGYNNRQFGANGYYTPKYPDQFEENNLIFLSAGFATPGKVRTHTRVYWRRHRDRFELFREDPRWYRLENGMAISNRPAGTAYDTVVWYSGHNHHINDVAGVQFNLSRKTKTGTTTLGWNLRSENIISTNIGYDKGLVVPVRGYEDVNYTLADNRTNFDMHLEQTFTWGPVYLSGGALLNWNTYLPDRLGFFPGIDLSYGIASNLFLTGSYNYTLGLPTFTDLTYEDPNNVGNNELLPYSMQSVEAGLKLLHGTGQSYLTVFYNAGEDVIDWVWFEDDSRYKPVNVPEYQCTGIEFSHMYTFQTEKELPFSPRSIRFNYTYLDMHKEIPGNIAKYSNLRQQFSGMITQHILNGINMSWNISYTEREGNFLSYDFASDTYSENAYTGYWLLDIRINYSFRWISVFAETNNILDSEYMDTGSIPQPGRTFVAGISINLEGKKSN